MPAVRSWFKRIACQQRVFWTACKGKRLFQDAYCRTHQDQGRRAAQAAELAQAPRVSSP